MCSARAESPETKQKTKANNDLPASSFAKATEDRRCRKHVGGILIDDMRPIFVLDLLDDVRAKQRIQTDYFRELGNFGPFQLLLPPLSVGRAKGVDGDKEWFGHFASGK